MSVITSRLPADRRLPRAIARLGFLNGLLGAALIGAGVGAYFAVAGTGTTTVPPQAATELNVGFMAAGTITSVAVKPGERVKRGQVLGHIDDTSAQQSLDQAQASLATAQAQYEATLTGETAVQRRQDALSIAQAKQTLANAEATKKQDAAQSAASATQAQNALRTDQGQEKVDLYQQTQDRATYANADAANAAIAADKTQLTNDQAKQQADTQQQLNLQHQQTV